MNKDDEFLDIFDEYVRTRLCAQVLSTIGTTRLRYTEVLIISSPGMGLLGDRLPLLPTMDWLTGVRYVAHHLFTMLAIIPIYVKLLLVVSSGLGRCCGGRHGVLRELCLVAVLCVLSIPPVVGLFALSALSLTTANPLPQFVLYAPVSFAVFVLYREPWRPWAAAAAAADARSWAMTSSEPDERLPPAVHISMDPSASHRDAAAVSHL